MDRNILIAHLRERYGLKSLPIFYPDIYKDQVNYSYGDIAFLYNRCIEKADVRAIELLTNQYDLNEVLKTANCGNEISYSRKYKRPAERLNQYRERMYNDRVTNKYYIGTNRYRKWFTERKGKITLNSRAVVYQMKRNDVIELFKLNNPNYKDNSYKNIIDLYEDLLKLPNKKELLIYYFKNLMDKFPIMEIEMLENDEIVVI